LLPLQRFISIAAFITIGTSHLPVQSIWSMAKGKKASEQSVGATTLEWITANSAVRMTMSADRRPSFTTDLRVQRPVHLGFLDADHPSVLRTKIKRKASMTLAMPVSPPTATLTWRFSRLRHAAAPGAAWALVALTADPHVLCRSQHRICAPRLPTLDPQTNLLVKDWIPVKLRLFCW